MLKIRGVFRPTSGRWVPWAVGLFAVSLCTLGDTAVAAQKTSSDAAAVELARLVYDRPNGKDASSQVIMRLAQKGKNTRQRVLYSYVKDKARSERWTLLRFVEPTDIEGTGLLTQDHPGDESDQWLYLPALDRVRRISSSRKGGRFVGSDFFYEDLRDREVDMDHHRLAGKGKVGGLQCDILESVPVDPDNSVYSKRVSCIHRKTLIPLQVDLYQGSGKKPIKRLRARKIKKIQGYWTVLDSTMYDLETGHQTSLETQKIKYDQALPDSLFSQQGLSDDSREINYRP